MLRLGARGLSRGPLASATAVCAAAVLLAGCGSSSSTSAAQPAEVALTRAAYVSSAAPGYRVVMNLRETVPSAGQVTINGTGSFAIPTHEGAMTMNMSIPSAAGAGFGNLQLQVVYVPGTFYMKFPPQLASRIGTSKPWVKVNLNQLGQASGLQGLGSLFNGSSSLNDPGQYLDFLRATATGTIRDMGQAIVNGIKTTHYHAVVDLSKLPNALPASARAAAKQLVAALRSRGAAAQLPIDAWIDSAHLVRRVALTYTEPIAQGQSAGVALQANYLDYGPQPAPAIPPSSQTQNLLSLTHGQP